MRFQKILLFSFLILTSNKIFAQEDLLKLAEEEQNTSNEKITATFKSTKIINAHTIETLKARNLDFRIGHRFGNIGSASGGGVHSFYGLDNASDIRIALEYGITNNLMIGISRNKRFENVEGLIKYKLLQQTTNNKVPLSIALFANTAITPREDVDDAWTKTAHRMSYTFQAILARKFSSAFSLAILPTLVHRNYVKVFVNPSNGSIDENDLYSLGVGGRLKITKRTAIIADYFYTFSEYRKDNTSTSYYNPLGVGVEIETGGHVFSIMFTNASGIIENDYIPNTTDTWTEGGYKFSFNISRVFKI